MTIPGALPTIATMLQQIMVSAPKDVRGMMIAAPCYIVTNLMTFGHASLRRMMVKLVMKTQTVTLTGAEVLVSVEPVVSMMRTVSLDAVTQNQAKGLGIATINVPMTVGAMKTQIAFPVGA